MIDFDKELQAILVDDPLGLLEVKPQTSHVVTADERLVAAFEEINTFVETHGHEPSASRDIQERKLYSRLQGLREDLRRLREGEPLAALGEGMACEYCAATPKLCNSSNSRARFSFNPLSRFSPAFEFGPTELA